MANLTNTVTNSLSLYGIKPTNRWNVMQWESNKWGSGDQDLKQAMTKSLGESLVSTSAVGKFQTKRINETISVDSDASNMLLIDRNGWLRVFPKPTTDSDKRANTVWSEA